MTSLVNFAQLASMQVEWNSLLEASLNPSFFLSFEWIWSWWQIFGEGGTLFVVQVRDEAGTLLALAPLYIQQRFICKVLPYRSLRMIGTNQANPDYLGFIVHRDHSDKAIASILHYIQERKDLWDELDLESLPMEISTSRGLLEQLNRSENLLCLNNDQHVMYIDLPGDMDSFLAGFSSKHRYNLRRRYRQFSQNHNGRFGKAETVESALQVLERLFHLHHLRASAIGRSEAFIDPRIRQLHTDFIRDHFANGSIYLYYLEIEGSIQACLYGFRHGDRFYFYQMGYNPEYDHISLGTTMMLKSIEYGITSRLRFFDFLRGEETYKQSWTRTQRQVKFVTYYQKSCKGLFLFGYRILRRAFRQAQVALSLWRAHPAAGGNTSY